MSEINNPKPAYEHQYIPYEPYPEDYARRFVSVKRTSGEVEKGWFVDGESTDSNGNERFVVLKIDENGQTLEKRIPKDQLIALQKEQALLDEGERLRSQASHDLSVRAVEQAVSIPDDGNESVSLSDRIARGWAVSRRDLLDSIEKSPQDDQKERERLHHEKIFAFPDPSGSDRYNSSYKERTRVSEQSARDAAVSYRYAKSDSELKYLFDQFRGDSWREEDMAKVLRETPELRILLGEHFLKRLDELGTRVPERVWRNSSNNIKNPNFPGYSDYQLSSKEYVAMLAIAMLDGTFKAERSPADTITINPYGEVTTGQHRYAAHILLGTERFANREYTDR